MPVVVAADMQQHNQVKTSIRTSCLDQLVDRIQKTSPFATVVGLVELVDQLATELVVLVIAGNRDLRDAMMMQIEPADQTLTVVVVVRIASADSSTAVAELEIVVALEGSVQIVELQSAASMMAASVIAVQQLELVVWKELEQVIQKKPQMRSVQLKQQLT